MKVPEEDPAAAWTAPSPEGPKAPAQKGKPWKWSEVRGFFHLILALLLVLANFVIDAVCQEKKEREALETIKASIEENARLEQALSDTRTEKDALQDNLDSVNELDLEMSVWLDEIGYLVDGSPYYHHFTCDALAQAGAYHAHDVGSCQEMGYSRCPVCWEARTYPEVRKGS